MAAGAATHALVALAITLALAAPAQAHTRSQSQSLWTVAGDGVDVRVETDAVEATRLYALGGRAQIAELFAEEVAGGLRLGANAHACDPVGTPRPLASEPGRVIIAWRFVCPAGALSVGQVEIESRLFHRVAPSHLHFAAVRDANGATAEAVLTSARPRAALSLATAPIAQSFWGAFTRFLPIGALHVWSGLDHVAFMLALVLLVSGRLRAAIFAASGFTIGHTLTLGLAAAGVLRPDTMAIEALIGFTIAFVALEVGEGGMARMRAWSIPIAVLLALAGLARLLHLAPMSPLIWFGLAAFVFASPRGFPRGASWLAAIFGLIHGCGFAGALNALQLPQPRLVASLFGFNLGVEFGQALVIGAALGVGLIARRLPATRQRQAQALAGAALFGLGGFWFVTRLLA